MSAPATSTRQRSTAAAPSSGSSSSSAPLSSTDKDGVDHSKPADKPQGKKLKQTSFSSFLNKLILAGAAICAFYAWRLSVQSAEVGGWWNLIRGKGQENISIQNQQVASSSLSLAAASATGTAFGAQPTVRDTHSLIIELADSIGVKPRELTLAIAPLLDPKTVTEETHEDATVADTAAGVAGAAGGVLGGVGTILETFVD